MNNNDYPLAVRARMHSDPTLVSAGRYYNGPPAVLIRWRDEWPDINEVPLAGETVWWTHNKEPYTVETGIPYRRVKNGPWLVDLLTTDGVQICRQISELTRTPPVEKVTGVKVGTMSTIGEKGVFIETDGIPPGTYAIVRVEDQTDE